MKMFFLGILATIGTTTFFFIAQRIWYAYQQSKYK